MEQLVREHIASVHRTTREAVDRAFAGAGPGLVSTANGVDVSLESGGPVQKLSALAGR